MHIDDIVIAKAPANGSSQIAYNVTVNGKPFARIWRAKHTRTCWDSWKVGFADGRKGVTGCATRTEAITAMRAAI